MKDRKEYNAENNETQTIFFSSWIVNIFVIWITFLDVFPSEMYVISWFLLAEILFFCTLYIIYCFARCRQIIHQYCMFSALFYRISFTLHRHTHTHRHTIKHPFHYFLLFLICTWRIEFCVSSILQFYSFLSLWWNSNHLIARSDLTLAHSDQWLCFLYL